MKVKSTLGVPLRSANNLGVVDANAHWLIQHALESLDSEGIGRLEVLDSKIDFLESVISNLLAELPESKWFEVIGGIYLHDLEKVD